jgi:hypothetical protein
VGGIGPAKSAFGKVAKRIMLRPLHGIHGIAFCD